MDNRTIRTPIDSVEAMERAFARLREAQSKFSTYTQQQVDSIFLAAATAAKLAQGCAAASAIGRTTGTSERVGAGCRAAAAAGPASLRTRMGASK